MTPTGVDTVIAGLVRGEFPVLYLRVDDGDRVVETNHHTRALLGPAVDRASFASLLAPLELPVSPSDLARSGPAVRSVRFVSAAGLPLAHHCCFAASDEGTIVLGGSLDEERLPEGLAGATEPRAAEAARLSNAALSRLNARKDAFLGMAAHDLRSPLLLILSLSDLLIESAEDPQQIRRDIASIRDAAALMQRIVEDFLDVALIESGRLRLERMPTALEDVVRKAIAVVQPSARLKHVSLRTDPRTPAPLVADAAKLQQVVINLATNAVQHSHPGGEVVIESGHEHGSAVLRVRDRGTGIRPEIRRNLFTAYAPEDRTKTAGERSTGLGLAISRTIVEAHDGRIEVDSAPGEGTTVTVRLPIRS